MKIALHDSDSTGYPNLALMKLSSFHKSKNDVVCWFDPLEKYDKIYSSKVFTFTPKYPYIPINSELGGTGYNIMKKLPDEIEHIYPDYSLYKCNYSMGFTTRGCIKNCSHCFVPQKEGKIIAHANIDEFVRHDKLVLMDNNILAHDHGIRQIELLAHLRIKIDINQGLDATLIDNAIARLLAKVKWLSPLRLACDSLNAIDAVRKAIEILRWHNVTPTVYFCYVLVKEIPEALQVIRFLKGMKIDPFAQPYRDKIGTEPTQEQKDFSRWVNHKAIFKTTTWEEYKRFF